MEESDRPDEFKVTDKRRFTTEGLAKEESASTEQEPPQHETRQEPPLEKPRAGGEKPEAPRPLDFSTFVLSLANTALFQLGFIKASETEEPQKDLPGARQTIDIIAMLEEKTRGNLTDQEKKILTESLFQLRMAFVEASK
ncbi:MAG: DUF1844 domain-containing protein [Desulfomonilaceae bacterium]